MGHPMPRGSDAPGSWLQRHKRSVENFQRQQRQAREAIAQARQAIAQAEADLARLATELPQAERVLRLEQERVDAEVLDQEYRETLARLDKAWNPADEARIFQILSAARLAGRSGHSASAAMLLVSRIKNPQNLYDRRCRFSHMLTWIKPAPASEGAAA